MATPLLRSTSSKAATALMTIAEVCDELKVARSTFSEWRATNRGPRCKKLPNGSVRIRRVDLESWLDTCEEAA
jgi:predicted DNA-binding transcriptional regulator AlpA